VLQCFFYSFSQSGFPLPLSSSIERPTRDERAQSIQLQFCVIHTLDVLVYNYRFLVIQLSQPSSPRQRAPWAALRRLGALVLFVPVIILMIYNNPDLTHQFHGKLFPYSLIHTWTLKEQLYYSCLYFRGPTIFPIRFGIWQGTFFLVNKVFNLQGREHKVRDSQVVGRRAPSAPLDTWTLDNVPVCVVLIQSLPTLNFIYISPMQTDAYYTLFFPFLIRTSDLRVY